jgi:flavin-dependent amine oxidoreductase
MHLRRRDLLKVASSTAAGVAATKLTMPTASASEGNPIVRDVCIIGGGSAGIYTAVRLGDLGKSVVVLEQKDRLGGHSETIDDAATGGVPIDIGVVVFENIPLVTNYFARFGVPLAPLNLTGGPTSYVDFRTGVTVAGYAPPGPAQLGAALGEYLELLATQFPYLDSGFQLPNPVPADLLAPFGDFVTKYGLQALVQIAFDFGQGLGNLLGDPAIYVLKNFSLSVADALATGNFLTAPGGSSQLYVNAGKALGSNVFLEAEVLRVDRSNPNAIEVDFVTPSGLKRVLCKKLVVACPPTLSNLRPVDLDPFETALFGKFRSNYYATALVKMTGLPLGLSVSNIGADTLYNLPPLPGVYGISPTAVPNLWNVKFGNPSWLPDFVVQAMIVQSLERIAKAGTYPIAFEEFIAFSSHAPFEMMVSSDDISRGFYTDLNSLQGRHDTFYNGAAFQTNDSSLIWAFTETLLPQIVA